MRKFLAVSVISFGLLNSVCAFAGGGPIMVPQVHVQRIAGGPIMVPQINGTTCAGHGPIMVPQVA